MRQKVATMNISLPATLRQRLEDKLDRHGYGSASEYVRDLIRRDLTREAIEKVDDLLLEGINSGPAVPVTKSWWKERHGHVRKAAAARTQRRRRA
jgi:antitoxin ParD1/3/4